MPSCTERFVVIIVLPINNQSMKENINNTWYSINKRLSKSPSTQFNILPTSNESELEVGKRVMAVANSFVDNAIVYTSLI